MIAVRDNAVELLQNIERHFLLGINERHDLELKHNLFVFNARLHRSCIVAYIVDIRKGVNRNRDLLPGGDDSFLIVACEDRRTRNDFELIRRFKQMHYGCKSVARCHVDVGSVAHILNDLAEVDQVGRLQKRCPLPRRCWFRCPHSE